LRFISSPELAIHVITVSSSVKPVVGFVSRFCSIDSSKGNPGVLLRRLLGFEEELARAADAETVIRGLGCAVDLDGILVDHILVRLGVALLVVHVPAQGREERVEELLPELHLIVLSGLVGLKVPVEAFDQIEDLLGAGNRFVA